MRHKLRLLNLILIVVFIFSFTACTIPKTATETTTAETITVETTTPETTTPITTVPETTIIEEPNIDSFDIKGFDKLTITFKSCLESSIAVEGGFTNGTFTCTAKPGMKFEILFFEYKNNSNNEQTTPLIGSLIGEEDKITTDDGNQYPIWSNGWAHGDIEYNRRESTQEEIDKFFGGSAGMNKLSAGQSAKGVATFEIPANSHPVSVTLQIGDNLYDIEIPEEFIIQDSNLENATEETITYEEALENHKTALKNYLSEAFDAELTKYSMNEDRTKLTVAYNTKWAVDETMKKELYDFTKGLTGGGNWLLNTDLELSSTNDYGDTIKAYMTYDNMIKLQNLEMSYEDWLKVAFK